MQSEVTRHNVVIGICTFRRPEGLAAVLNGLINQTFRHIAEPDIQIVVIDNDADPSVERYLQSFADNQGVNIKYLAEPQRGISQARNRFIKNIPESADLVAFLDDDEVPVNIWLDELIHGLFLSKADAISAPVVPEFIKQPPKWLLDGKFFTTPRRKSVRDYEPVQFGVMGNFLMRRALLDNKQLFFPETLGLVGSEDSWFFAGINAMGAKMTWVSTAIAVHRVPESRMTLSYLLKREFRVGCGKILVLRMSGPSRATILKQGGSDFTRLLIKLTILIPASAIGYLNKNHYERIKPLFDVWQFAGRLYGLLGLRYQQYK